MSSDLEEQLDELLALLSIFDPEEFLRNESKSSGEFRVSVELPKHFTVTLRQGDELSQYKISYLPPLCLDFDLPEDYPSCSAPSYSLKCSWLLPNQLSSLAAQLDDLYQTTGGAAVLFTWAQFLKYDALDFLGITDVLELPSNEDTTEEDLALNLDNGDADFGNEAKSEGNTLDTEPSTSEAAESDVGASNVARLEHQTPVSLSPGQALLSQLLIHDAAQRKKAFSSQQFDCGVCFMSLLGADCVQLVECGHVFCRTCLAEFCRVQIINGNVREVTCLEAGCKAAPTHAQLRSLVGDELFSRYDRLLLQISLDSMSDVMYCPRFSCASAVLTDSSSSMALCTVCGFAFCVKCLKTYHGCDACHFPTQTPDYDGQYLEFPQSQEGIQALWQDYTSATKERRKLLESRYGRYNIQGILQISLSKNLIAVSCKRCPQCSSPIEKDGGCDYMKCSKCHHAFCWNCFKWPCACWQMPPL